MRVLKFDMLVQATLTAIGLTAAVAHVVPDYLAGVPTKPLFLAVSPSCHSHRVFVVSPAELAHLPRLTLAPRGDVDASQRRLEVTLPCLVILQLDYADTAPQRADLRLCQLQVLHDLFLLLESKDRQIPVVISWHVIFEQTSAVLHTAKESFESVVYLLESQRGFVG